MKPVTLANVRKFRKLLGDNISIIGTGGIKTGIDVFELLLAGANAVQVGTTYMKEGSSCFERIEKELSIILKLKNYTSLDQFCGKLKEL
jgi:dihydroorotate dehydrogenase (fumarate)